MIQSLITHIRDMIWSTPFLIFIVGVGCIVTCALSFIQFTNFFKSWRLVLGGEDENPATGASGDMSSFQAFLSALSVSIGNGSLAGIGAALYMGGPGAVFWMFLIGLIGMALRFAEVFLGVSFSMRTANGQPNPLGGPFAYISELPFGRFLATTYAVGCLFYGFISGNAMQCNSVSTALHDVTGFSTAVIGVALAAFVLYVMLGGANRIIKVSDAIVPVKVGLFFISMLIVLAYHWAEIIPAFVLIVENAFNPVAAMGGLAGISMVRVFAVGASRTINATEAGLGTAAVFYGNTGSEHPMNDGISSMLGTFISSNLVALLVSVSLIASGVWSSGQDGAVMVVSAYETVFGIWGGIIVSILTMVFGMGVFVAYGYVARQCWLYLTHNRFEMLFVVLFAITSFIGAIASIQAVWAAVDLCIAVLLSINLIALVYFIPYMRRKLAKGK